MIITQSQIHLQASHQQSSQISERENLQLIRTRADGSTSLSEVQDDSRVSLSQQALSLSQRINTTQIQTGSAASQASTLPATAATGTTPALDEQDNLLDNPELSPRLRLMASIISAMFGAEIKLNSLTTSDGGAAEANVQDATTSVQPRSGSTNSQASQTPAGPGQLSGLRYEYQRTETLSETTQFSAAGQVVTRDGQTFQLGLRLDMAYQRSETQSLTFSAGVQLKDPLVINFSGTAAQLSAQTLNFDLDADGKRDSFHFVTANSGLLVLDKNRDGRINDGRELFGALSGDGFADLARYDEDGNGFIDEADSVFSELQIWIRSDSGEDQLSTLQEKGIGALYLGSVDTPFTLYSQDDTLAGKIRASGLYLGENGSAGTLQQIDLVV